MSVKKPAGSSRIETVLPMALEELVRHAEKELVMPLELKLSFLSLMTKHEAVNALLAMVEREQKIRHLRPRLKAIFEASIATPTNGNT